MRRSLGKFSNPTISNATKHSLIAPSSAFSTSSGGGGGRGRGRGSTLFEFTASDPPRKTQPDDDDPSKIENQSPFPSGLGHGRGKPLPSSPTLPSFSSFMSAVRSGSGAGRGRAIPIPQSDEHKRPIFFRKEDAPDESMAPKIGGLGRSPQDSNLPSSLLSVLSGAGRGMPTKPVSDGQPKEENRHLRTRQPGRGRIARAVAAETERGSGESTPRLSRKEAVKKAVGILSRGDGAVGDRMVEKGGGRGRGGFRGRGDRGRRAWDREMRSEGRGDQGQDSEDEFATELYLGDNGDGEKLAKRVGPETMDNLVEAFEEMSGRVLPSPIDDEYLDALHTNLLVKHVYN